MAKISPRGAAARQLLASLPEFASGDKSVGQLSDAYANRLASAARRQLAAGVTPSRQAARGHVLTPEHGQSGPAPKLPEKVENYRRARETAIGGETPPAPSQRVTGAFAERPRPRHHARPPYQGHIPYADNGEIYTLPTEREAESILHYASGLEPVGRVRLTMQVFDCSKNHYFPVLSHTWKYGGVAIDDLYTLWRDHGGSLEDWLIDQINGGPASDSDRPAGGITHICLYEITILPRARLAD